VAATAGPAATAEGAAGATAVGASAAPGGAAATPTAASGGRALSAHRLTTLDSGTRVVTEAMPSVRSVALGFWMATGSALEGDAQAGLSHLVEHMLFRGSDRYGSLELDQLFDALGGDLNAGTGKDNTSVHARVLDERLPEAFDAMADMVWRPRMDGEDLEAERRIVLEEIAMYEDDPQDKVFDVLGEAVFGDHPLGRAIIGTPEVIDSVGAGDLAAFHATRYRPEQVVIAAAGSVDHDALVELARAADPGRPTGAGPLLAGQDPPPEQAGRLRFVTKPTEQVHVCLGGPGINRHDDRRFALRVLDTVLGGTSSSRLFQKVREERGLAYAVYSFQATFHHSGQFGIYLGTRPDNLAESLRVVAGELELFGAVSLPEDELRRAKEHVKGRVVLSLESTMARMSRLGTAVLGEIPLLEVDELLERIDAVSAEDVAALAFELLAPHRMSAAGIGADEDTFRSAVALLSPSLGSEEQPVSPASPPLQEATS